MSTSCITLVLNNGIEKELELNLTTRQFIEIIADQFKVDQFTAATFELACKSGDVIIKMNPENEEEIRVTLI
jgi:hypothetical protein